MLGGGVLWLNLGNERRSGNECATSDWRARDQVSLVNQSCHVGTRQDTEGQEDAHRKTSCFTVAGGCCVFWGVGMGSLGIVTVGARSLGGGNIILPCTTRRDPQQLGSAEATTDAHFEEQSLHPCSQDAPWHRRQGMPVASRILNQAPHTPPCLIARPWPANALENPHEAPRSNVRTAKQATQNSKRRCRECLERQRKGLHMDRHDEEQQYEPGQTPEEWMGGQRAVSRCAASRPTAS